MIIFLNTFSQKCCLEVTDNHVFFLSTSKNSKINHSSKLYFSILNRFWEKRIKKNNKLISAVWMSHHQKNVHNKRFYPYYLWKFYKSVLPIRRYLSFKKNVKKKHNNNEKIKKTKPNESNMVCRFQRKTLFKYTQTNKTMSRQTNQQYFDRYSKGRWESIRL